MRENPMLQADTSRDHYVTLTDDDGQPVRFHLHGTATTYGRALTLDAVQVELGTPGLYFESGNLLDMLSEYALADLAAAAGYAEVWDPGSGAYVTTGYPPTPTSEDIPW